MLRVQRVKAEGRTRHGPDRTRTDFSCGETPLGPCGTGRVRVVEFSFNLVVCMCTGHDRSSPGIESRRKRSKINAKVCRLHEYLVHVLRCLMSTGND